MSRDMLNTCPARAVSGLAAQLADIIHGQRSDPGSEGSRRYAAVSSTVVTAAMSVALLAITMS